MPLGVTSKSQYKLLLSLKDNCQRSKPCVPPFGPVGCGSADFFATLDFELPGFLPPSPPPGDHIDVNFGVSVMPVECVGDMARLIAVNADVACQAMHDGQVI